METLTRGSASTICPSSKARNGRQPLSPPPRKRGPSSQGEKGHVGPQITGELEESGLGKRIPEKDVEGPERGPRIRRAASQAGSKPECSS